MTTPPYVPCEDEPDGPLTCECVRLFGVRDGHLTPAQKENLFVHQTDRELALTELMVRVLDAALHLGFSEKALRQAVVALAGDEGRFNGLDDSTVAEADPHDVLDQIRLYASLG